MEPAPHGTSAQLSSPVRYGTAAARRVLLATVLGSSLAFIDATVVNLALPELGRGLHASAAGLQWTVNGYALSLASLILVGGSLGDRFGRKRVFLAGVAWFALASLLCGLAPSIELLITARVLQGIGGALLTPGALAILEASFAPDDRARAIGAWSGLGGIGGALGPFLGGWLLQIGSWRLLFLINVPVAALVLWVAHRHVPESRDPAAARGFDIAGLLTGIVGLGGLTYGFTAWPAHGAGSPVVLIPLALGVLGMAAFVLAELRAPHPMVPPEIFRHRAFTGANLVTFLVYAANGGVFFLVVVNLQVVAGYPALAAGLSMLPITVIMLLLSARGGALGQRIGPRIPMTAGPLVCAAALLLMSTIGPHAPYATRVLPAVILFGLGLALLVAPLTATALGALDDAHAGIASGVNNAVARAAGLLAVAVLPLAAGLGSGSLTDAAALHPVYHHAMLLCAALMLAGSLTAFLTVPTRPPTTSSTPSPHSPDSADSTPTPAITAGRTPAIPHRSFCDPASPPIPPRDSHPIPSSPR
ncbi:major facilitator transporter [Actinoplanes sp. SE50]|uniref:DHA2 family efflux MFS transporter permease subunit n=1 Tax=unclassified Actinoplanes TaxID=2626549 RepID=UPI00023EC8B3|nr:MULTISPECIES: DHA2 family efflux MFS transporter permease subunit [unclassified Actinoplanes]AEV81476.1 drug resistance efflux protein [Actinoplanes sp. SE50/110]ATO79879.1 major facilitator transporter [Actinoplanes sp. SE50]SLL97281.1 MFS transporter [Actinoplanes sp. SE50/110]